MKTYLYILFSLAIAVSVVNCDPPKDDSPSRKRDITTIEVLPDSIKQKIDEQNSLMNALVDKVNDLTSELNTSKNEIESLHEEIEGKNKPYGFYKFISIAAILLSIITLISEAIRKNGLKKEEVDDVVIERLRDSEQIKKLQEEVKNLKSKTKLPHQTSSIEDIESRLVELEDKIRKLAETPNASLPNNVINFPIEKENSFSEEAKVKGYQRTGYANINSEDFFTQIFPSNQESCVFIIKFNSDLKGEFNIISLDKLKSRNGWQEVVLCTGVSIQDATDFKVEESGICEKIDDNTWQVKKPLKITLIK